MSHLFSISYAPASLRDATDIWTYVADRDPRSADRLLDRIESKIALLASSPQIGRVLTSRWPGIRVVLYRRYLILYRVHSGDVEIVRILHGMRDLTQIEV